MFLFVAFCARWAGAFDDKGDGVGDKAGGKGDGGDGGVLQTKGLLAGLAIEMEMTVGVTALAIMVVAEFVMDHSATVLKSMHHIVFREQGQYAEDTRLIQVEHLVLQVLQAHRAVQIDQCAIDQNTIDGRLHRFMLQVLYDGLSVHIVEMLDVRTLRC